MPKREKICLNEDEAMQLIQRLESWVEYTEKEMHYLRKSIEEIKGEIRKVRAEKQD